MVIIYGSRYYFAHTKNKFQGRCSNCNHEVTLKSYTARKFSHLYFIPLIPHGKHRVLADCPKCHHVEYMEYDKWMEARDKDFAAIREHLAEHPDDPKNLLAGLALSIKYMERSMYEQFAEGAFLAFNHNCEVMELTWAAAERFGDKQNSQRALEACIGAGGTPGADLEWSRLLLLQDRFDEAREFAVRAIDGQAQNMVRVIPEFAKSFMRANRNEMAAELMRKLLLAMPTAGDSRQVRQTVRKLNACLANDSAIDLTVGFGARLGDWTRSVALWGTLCLAILGFIYALGCYAFGNFRTVYILNGTHQSAVVSIDGDKSVTVKPLSHVPVSLPEGRHRFLAKYNNNKFTVSPTFSTPFFSRLFQKQPTYILNPDGMALVTKRSVAESRNAMGGSLFIPGKWLILPAIDFVFSAPPAKCDPGKDVLSLYQPAAKLKALAADLRKLGGQALVRQYLAKLPPWTDQKDTLAVLREKYRVRFTYPFTLISGLEYQYTITLAGQTLKLNPLSHVTINIREQPLTLSCPDNSLPIAATTIKVPKDFWLNGNNRNILHLVNPDQRAVLLESEVIYGKIGRDPNFHLHGGELFLSLPGIDYVFKEAPKQAAVGSVRTQLIQFSEDWYLRFLVSWLKEKPESVKTEILRRLKYLPENEPCLMLLRPVVGRSGYMTFLKKQLAIRPLLINVHRKYQDNMEIAKPAYDLVVEYKSYLRQDPANAGLQYLLGRVTPAGRDRLALYRKAMSAPKPCNRAIMAMAFEYIGQGRFAEAMSLLRKNASALRGNRTATTMTTMLLMAMGKHKELLARNTAALKQDPLSYSLVIQRIRLLVAMGNPNQAEELIKSYLVKIKARPAGELKATKKYLRIALLQSQGRLGDVAAMTKTKKDPDSQYDIAIYTGEFDKALRVATKTNPYISYFLPLYIAASGKDKATARTALASAIKILRHGRHHQRLAASWLSGEQTPAATDILELPLPVADKLLLVTALGLKLPALRHPCFKLARKLNFNLVFPHWIIANCIKAAP